MNSAVLLLIAIALLTLGYRIYGKLLTRLFGVDPKRATPAHTKSDGVDYVPVKHWWILFGHHFSSICGAGPIVGAVLAGAYWGWLPAVIWLIVGAIWMGAVSDFSSLFVSVRSGGKSIAEIASPEISRTARSFFAFFIWIAIILVIAVFAIFAAKTFIQEPTAVMPSFGLIPTALLVGWMLYRRNLKAALVTPIGLGVLIGLLLLGQALPVVLPSFGSLSPEMLWMLILFAYCFIASITPVQVLLQPRDYLASFILFAVIAIGVVSVFFVHAPIQQAAFRGFNPSESNSGPLWPMLFVTIACGAISGFHTLVSSGTTCKQITSEAHCCRIGYGGMLLECLVGVLVLICVTAGLTHTELLASLKSGGPISAFSEGYGRLSSVFLQGFGKPFAILALNAFILTTLDTATRIARYLTAEVFQIKNKYLATLIVVIASAALALTGQWNRLWPAFGAANQLIAGIALLVVACWLLRRKKPSLFALVPAILMLVTTVAALGFQIKRALSQSSPDVFIAGIASLLIGIALVICLEALKVIRKPS